tara:strand:+ start:482 stop:616 length:135 start_codon:yes stop_codon:yes gene_type:complete
MNEKYTPIKNDINPRHNLHLDLTNDLFDMSKLPLQYLEYFDIVL